MQGKRRGQAKGWELTGEEFKLVEAAVAAVCLIVGEVIFAVALVPALGEDGPAHLRPDALDGGVGLEYGTAARRCGEVTTLDSSAPASRMDQTGSTRSYPTSTTARCRKERKAQRPEKDAQLCGNAWERTMEGKGLGSTAIHVYIYT
eukprot:351341-Chlamydomonas_euryale.AAC.2